MLKELCAKSSEGRRLVIGRIHSKFFNFARKLSNFNSLHHFLKVNIVILYNLINIIHFFLNQDILDSFSVESEVSPLEKILSEHSQLKILHESLRYSFEKVQTFERWIKRDQTIIDQFFDKAPIKSESIDDEVDLESINTNGFEDNFFDFEEFDKKKKK